MTLGQIMVEALRLMFAGNDEMLVPEYIERIEEDVQFRDYCQMMPGSITRCLYDMERRRVIPDVIRALSEQDMEAAKNGLPIWLSWNPAPSGELRFFACDKQGIIFADVWDACRFVQAGISSGAKISAVYTPKITPVTADTERDTEVCVPDRLACMIPYFIKAECLRMDQSTAGEAGHAWNVYEAAMLEEADRKITPMQRRVQDTTGFSEWSEFV